MPVESVCSLSRTLLIVAALRLLAPTAVLAGQRTEPKQLGQVLAELHVVEGKVSSVKVISSDGKGTVSEAQFDVWRVYCGDGLSETSKFTALVGQGRPGLWLENRQLPLLDPKDRDHRIWLIEWEAGRGRYTGQPHVGTLLQDVNAMSLTDCRFLLPFLGHQGGDEPEKLEAAPKVAAALYSLEKSKDEAERGRLLEEQFRTGDPYVAVTDCWLLFQVDGMPDRNGVATRLFLDPRVPIPARASLDNLLHRECGMAGIEPTPERDKAFTEMATGGRTNSDFYSLGIAMRRRAGRGLSVATCIEVTRTALRNEHFLGTCSEDETVEFVDFTESVKTEEDRDRAFDFFSTLIGPGADVRFEFAAATAIAAAEVQNRLTPKQGDRLSVLRAASHNQKVLDLLARAILAAKVH